MTGTNQARSAALVKRLTAKARKLATAHGHMRRLARARDPIRWRKPDLLWPLTTKG